MMVKKLELIRFSRDEQSKYVVAWANIVTEDEEQEIRIKIGRLRQEHRDLDAAIDALMQSGPSDPLQIQRLKKQKLRLKDTITVLEDSLFPDIIA